jgi:transcriptional regulator with XRE-family HTH domain
MQPVTGDELRRAFGVTLRRLRLRAGIAQERLALESGLDRAYMSMLERGAHAPTLETIFRLLPPLGITFTGFARALERTLKQSLARRP